MDFEIIDEIYSNVIDMDDDYEIVKQEVRIQPTISSSSLSSLSPSLSLSYQWIIILVLLLLFLIINIVRYIKHKNDYKKLKETLLVSSSSSLDDELTKLEKELYNDSLSKTFILRLQMITDHIIHDTTTTTTTTTTTDSNKNNIMK